MNIKHIAIAAVAMLTLTGVASAAEIVTITPTGLPWQLPQPHHPCDPGYTTFGRDNARLPGEDCVTYTRRMDKLYPEQAKNRDNEKYCYLPSVDLRCPWPTHAPLTSNSAGSNLQSRVDELESRVDELERGQR
jgi:hypothetical protein